MLMLSRKTASIIAFILLSLVGFAQPSEKEYNYFLFPINPGVRNTLAGTMGELRTSHFHTGIDIRTEGRQGMPVVASADGYVSRIAVSGGGYGNALYITHPNGKVTVYGHLKEFKENIGLFVLKAQYAKKSFEVNLFPKPDQFVFSKGDTIALSGNSGSSGGPHLHFDIRDKNQNLLNPLHFGFKEITDTRTPFAKTIALVPFNIDSRIEGIFSRIEYNLEVQGNEYVFTDTLIASGEIGLELYAWDRMNGTRFKTGINHLKVRINDKEIFDQLIDTWSFSNARSFYQHINYESMLTTGQRFHKLYIENGNTLKFYKTIPNRGRLKVEDGQLYNVVITLTDSYDNTTHVRFTIKGDKKAKKEPSITELPNSLKINRNTLRVVGDSLSGNLANVEVGNELHLLKSEFSSNGYPVFLWDLRKSIPTLIALRDTTLYTNIISMVPPKQDYVVFNSHTDIEFKDRSLFDTLYLNLSYSRDTLSDIDKISIGNPAIPLKGSITLHYKPEKHILDEENSAIYQVYGKDEYGFVGGEWKENRIEFSIRNFGEFTVLQDSIAPTIKPLIINRQKIFFELEDKLSGLNKIEATIDGNWLLIAKDPKKKLYWAEKEFEDQKFQGELILEVTDNSKNKRTYKTTIK